MSRAQVPRAAIDASLWFILGRSLDAEHPKSPAVPELETEVVGAVSQMLADQRAVELTETVLDTISAGRERVGMDPSLSLSAKRYDQLRAEFLEAHALGGKGRALWPVGSTTALKRAGGSWNAALAQAGLATSAKPEAAGFGSARFTADQFDAAINDFKIASEETGSATTYQRYVQWQRDQKQQGRPDRPSGAAVRNAFGSWRAALESTGPNPDHMRSAEHG